MSGYAERHHCTKQPYRTPRERQKAVGRGPVPRLVAESALFRRGRRVCLADINIDFHAGIFLKERAEWGCVRDGVSSKF